MPFTAKVMDLTCLRMVGSLFCEGIRYADIKRETMVGFSKFFFGSEKIAQRKAPIEKGIGNIARRN